jgi:hypothetical protein
MDGKNESIIINQIQELDEQVNQIGFKFDILIIN